MFRLFCSRTTEVFFKREKGKTYMYSFSRPILSQGTTSATKVYIIDLVVLSRVHLPGLKFTYAGADPGF